MFEEPFFRTSSATFFTVIITLCTVCCRFLARRRPRWGDIRISVGLCGTRPRPAVHSVCPRHSYRTRAAQHVHTAHFSHCSLARVVPAVPATSEPCKYNMHTARLVRVGRWRLFRFEKSSGSKCSFHRQQFSSGPVQTTNRASNRTFFPVPKINFKTSEIFKSKQSPPARRTEWVNVYINVCIINTCLHARSARKVSYPISFDNSPQIVTVYRVHRR